MTLVPQKKWGTKGRDIGQFATRPVYSATEAQKCGDTAAGEGPAEGPSRPHSRRAPPQLPRPGAGRRRRLTRGLCSPWSDASL